MLRRLLNKITGARSLARDAYLRQRELHFSICAATELKAANQASDNALYFLKLAADARAAREAPAQE